MKTAVAFLVAVALVGAARAQQYFSIYSPGGVTTGTITAAGGAQYLVAHGSGSTFTATIFSPVQFQPTSFAGAASGRTPTYFAPSAATMLPARIDTQEQWNALPQWQKEVIRLQHKGQPLTSEQVEAVKNASDEREIAVVRKEFEALPSRITKEVWETLPVWQKEVLRLQRSGYKLTWSQAAAIKAASEVKTAAK